MTLNEAIQIMTNEIVSVLADNKPSIYLFGSVVLDDFKLGWSDIDIIVLTEREISEQHADIMVGLRQKLLERFPGNGNPYFRLFEGGMLSADAFLNGRNERTVYWGTSGQRITDNYKMDSFGMAELLDSGILLYGDDIRNKMAYPTYAQMRDDIARHVWAARKYGVVVGWLLDIARGIYTLRTGKVIAKTAAGEWALEKGLCPDIDAIKKAVKNRLEAHLQPEKSMDNAVIQRFADVIDAEFVNTAGRFAESELKRMGMAYDNLTLIRYKDGVSVWRLNSGEDGFVMKCFDKPEYRREIDNYQILGSLGVPTLKMIAHTDCSLVMEDIERSVYRLGTAEDMKNPKTAKLIAAWYKTLHQNGREYVNTHGFIDEYDKITIENLKFVQEKTGTGGEAVWRLIEDNFKEIISAVMGLPRTLVYSDFHYSNLAVARDGSRALVFDYNFLYKSYVYSDIRNVCWDFSDEAKAAFLSEYGGYDEREAIADDVADALSGLIIACRRKVFPAWAEDSAKSIKNGSFLAAVERLLNQKIIAVFESKTQEKVCSVHRYEDVPNNSVYRIETDAKPYIFKAYSSRGWPEDGKLPYVNKKLNEHNIPHAALCAFDRKDERFPNGYLIEECLPGTTADRLTLTRAENVALFEKLAELMSRVHRIKMSGYGYIGGGAAGWSSFSKFMGDSLGDNITFLRERGLLDNSEAESLESEIVTRLKICDSSPSVLCHGDLSLKNVLVSRDDITLIDWDDAYALCWAADIANLTLWMKRTYRSDAEIYRKAFLDRYQTDDDINLFYQTEDILHVRYGLDLLNFFSGNPNYHGVVEATKTILRESFAKCGIKVLRCLEAEDA